MLVLPAGSMIWAREGRNKLTTTTTSCNIICELIVYCILIHSLVFSRFLVKHKSNVNSLLIAVYNSLRLSIVEINPRNSSVKSVNFPIHAYTHNLHNSPLALFFGKFHCQLNIHITRESRVQRKKSIKLQKDVKHVNVKSSTPLTSNRITSVL